MGDSRDTDSKPVSVTFESSVHILGIKPHLLRVSVPARLRVVSPPGCS